jgi:uncharacterized membrane protein (DUF373 family)
LRETVVRWIERLEDGIYIVVSLLLALAAVFLLVSGAQDAVTEISTIHGSTALVLNLLDKGLVLFMVAELLHTVRITVRDRSLAAEPFLIVGLIAGIRRVLILTAQADTGFQWNPQGIQLVILIGLILVMAVAILIWRRSERFQEEAQRT